MTTIRKSVMRRAWEIYRILTGGDRIARLSVALKKAWAEVKAQAQQTAEKTFGGKYGTITESDLEKLISIGANRWQKAGRDRLYLSGAGAEIMGLEIDRYKSGNICYATLDGEKISNADGGRALSTYQRAYIDLTTGALKEVTGKYADFFTEKMSVYVKKAV